jgi:hypothetical protein
MVQLRLGGVESQGNITLAVSAVGSDAPSINRPAKIVMGDYSAYPFLTIQAAVDALPINIGHTTAINIGAGNFAGFHLHNKSFGMYGVLSAFTTISGTRDLSTLATGPNTGTATSGTGRTLTLTGASWTVDDLVGRFLRITAGSAAGRIAIIAANTTDTITLASVSTVMSGTSVFEIVEPTTKITSPDVPSSAGIAIHNAIGSFMIQDIDISGCSFGITSLMQQNSLAQVRRITTHGGFYGMVFQDCGRVSATEIGILNSTSIGIAFIGTVTPANSNGGWLFKGCSGNQVLAFSATGWATIYYGTYIRDCTAVAVWTFNSQNLYLNNLVIDGCTTAIQGVNSWIEIQSGSISNCTVGPFGLFNCELYIDGTALAGIGNTGWGLDASGPNNFVTLASTPTITGSLGDVTVDGTADVTWVSLSTAGDYALAVTNGSHIVRR